MKKKMLKINMAFLGSTGDLSNAYIRDSTNTS